MPFPIEVLIAAWAVTLVAGMLQGTVGFGFAVLSVPILTILDPALTPIPQVLMAFPVALTMAIRERAHLDLHGAGWIIAGRVPGAVIGALLLSAVSEATLNVIIAGVVLAAVAALASGLRVRLDPVTKFSAGVVSGITGTTSAVGGPPLALLYRSATGGTLRASLGAIFSIGVVINVTTLTVAGQIHWSDVTTALLLLPAAAAGLWLSRFLTGKVEGEPLRRAILVVAALAAGGLVVRTLAG